MFLFIPNRTLVELKRLNDRQDNKISENCFTEVVHICFLSPFPYVTQNQAYQMRVIQIFDCYLRKVRNKEKKVLST